MSNHIVVPLLIVIAAVIATALLSGTKTRRKEGTYISRSLLTDNELEFFDRLVRALPDHYIFPQVSMSALLVPASRDKKQSHSDRLRIAQHRADYVVCDFRCNVVAVVELDDRTHSKTKDDARDNRLRQGGMRTIGFQSRNKPTMEAIRTAVLVPLSQEVSASVPTL